MFDAPRNKQHELRIGLQRNKLGIEAAMRHTALLLDDKGIRASTLSSSHASGKPGSPLGKAPLSDPEVLWSTIAVWGVSSVG